MTDNLTVARWLSPHASPGGSSRQAWLGKNLDLQPIPLPFPGR